MTASDPSKARRNAVFAILAILPAAALIVGWAKWHTPVLYAAEQVLAESPSEPFAGVLMVGAITETFGFIALIPSIILGMMRRNQLVWPLKTLPIIVAGATTLVGLFITLGAILK